jgi:translation initiation factor 1A
MPGAKKKKGGKRARRGKKNTNTDEQRNLRTIDPELEKYYRAEKLLGERRVSLVDEKGNEIIGVIRGKFRKRVWINVGDIVICSVRSFQKDRVDIIHKFSPQEAKRLVRKKEIPASLLGEEVKTIEETQTKDGIVWNVQDSDDEAEEDTTGKKEQKIAPQPEKPDINDISSDSYEIDESALRKMDTQSILDAL